MTDVEGNAQRAAAGSGVVEAQNSTVDVGFIAGTVAVEALSFVGRAEESTQGVKPSTRCAEVRRLTAAVT